MLPERLDPPEGQADASAEGESPAQPAEQPHDDLLRSPTCAPMTHDYFFSTSFTLSSKVSH